MKNYSLIVALLVLLVVSVSLADSMPVPEDAGETIESGGTIEVTVEPTPMKHYSWGLALLGNAFVPGVGYFLIEETWWGVAELGIAGGGIFAMLLLGLADDDAVAVPGVLAGVAYFGGLIHAPLLAEYKNNQQKVALDLSPGLGLDSEGGAYPTVQLTLSF